MKNLLFCLLIPAALLHSCSISKKIGLDAKKEIFSQMAFTAAHTGISIYEPSTGKSWYHYQAEKYFVPASNTKLLTCYAAMKYLGDSVPSIQYYETNDTLYVLPLADPSFLNPEFKYQPVYEFLKNSRKNISINTRDWKDERWGNGWAWNDYNDADMLERSIMPIYGNYVEVYKKGDEIKMNPSYFTKKIIWTYDGNENVKRHIDENIFEVNSNVDSFMARIPFVTSGNILAAIIADTLKKKVVISGENFYDKSLKTIKSIPVDSLLKPMMYRSNNFYAEQSLMMVSHQLTGVMNDANVIDTLLKTSLSSLPQKPRWVDGSGLSRYNLFSPQDFITILGLMKDEFGMDRIKGILATGGTGTIKNFYRADSGFIFAKTGTLNGVVAFSGFLYTKKNKLLLFSVLVNNHRSSPNEIRRAIERFIEGIRRKY